MSRIVPVVSWIISLWICKVFLSSIPYKFSGHPDTEHIFSTIGLWIQDIISVPLGELFIVYGAIVVGSAELIVSSILLLPAVFFILSWVGIVKKTGYRAYFHGVGGLLASMVMAGAAFFHIATPLGIEVLHNGVSDHGSLFYAALSILVLGLVMALLNFQIIRQNKQ
jgi:hypothetical protein